MAHELSAVNLAPASAQRVRNSFFAEPSACGTWQVNQVTSWIDRNGEDDGDICDIENGLSEAEARAIADRLNGVERKEAA